MPVQSGTRTSKMTPMILKWSSAVLLGSSAETTIAKRASSRLLERLGWQTLQERREAARLTLFYKIVNKHVAVDTGNPLRASTRNPRSNSALSPAFINIQTTRDCYKYSFFPRTIADWNQLSPRTREATSVDAFKALLCVPSAHCLDLLPAHSLLKPCTLYPLRSWCALIIRIRIQQMKLKYFTSLSYSGM